MQVGYYITQLHRTFGVVIFTGNYLKKIIKRLTASIQLLCAVVKRCLKTASVQLLYVNFFEAGDLATAGESF